jgi:uncharacterized protein (TIGR02147 family)
MVELFEYWDYKAFLNDKLDELDRGGRGARARMSRAIGCQTAYTAQVLRGEAHFSLEQAESINDFLGHTDDSGHYFLLLVQLFRSGTPQLRSRFKKQIDALREGRLLLKNRLGVQEHLAEHEQLLYYSSWIYGAVHALASISGYQTPERIADRLQINVRSASEALEFLVKASLLERTSGGQIVIVPSRVNLPLFQPFVSI